MLGVVGGCYVEIWVGDMGCIYYYQFFNGTFIGY